MSMKTLAARLQYQGGDELGRIREMKLRSLRAALKGSYNSRKIKTPNHSIWQCLINKNLLKSDYDRQYISVEFDSQLSAGDTFECLDDGTHWMIYLPILTETAYLRSEIIRCRYQLNVDDVDYWVYFQGPTETTIQWFQKGGVEYNEPNLSGTVYIKKDPRTENFFHRFDKIRINGLTWQVQVVDKITVPGIIELELQEYFNNSIEDLPKIVQEGCHEIIGLENVEQNKSYGYMIRDSYYRPDYHWRIEGNPRVEIAQEFEDGRTCEILVHDGAVKGFKIVYGDRHSGYNMDVKIARRCSGIKGPKEVYPYDIVEYSTPVSGQFWVDSSDVEIIERSPQTCLIEVKTGKSGSFTLGFTSDADNIEIKLPITILSF